MSDRKDWAPIYLSEELINTEYGSLLNITDQLLKSWSQNGLTKYINFNYRVPVKWPFEKPLIRIVITEFKADTVTFNWNTKGVGYIMDNGQSLCKKCEVDPSTDKSALKC